MPKTSNNRLPAGFVLTIVAGDLSYSVAQPNLATSVSTITPALVNGAITIATGTVVFTKAGVAAMTLAAPTAAQAGTIMRFVAGTANAHTLTATGLIEDGVTGGDKNLATPSPPSLARRSRLSRSISNGTSFP